MGFPSGGGEKSQWYKNAASRARLDEFHYAVMLSTILLTTFLSAAAAAPAAYSAYKHVFALSVDGLHASDVEKYVALRPKSNMASLLSTGIEYKNAYTSGPSDSFPGIMAQFTGASPRTTGVWYDDVWDWTWYDAGSNCEGPAGAEVQFAENLDYNSSLLFSGGIDPANLPMAIVNGKCVSVYPHSRLLVNTVFEVVHGAGHQTAYVDKHAAYDLVRGPSGTGVTVGYFPEIAAVGPSVDDNIGYDKYHVQAWLDFIDGTVPANSEGSFSTKVMPALMGGNFQSVSVAQKTVGYNADQSLSAAILKALDFVDNSLGQIVSKLNSTGNLESTLLIVASKHGQAPINPALLHKIDPHALLNATGVPTAFITSDDIGLIWLNNTADIPNAVANLQAKAGSLGIAEIISGTQLVAQGFGNPLTSQRVPHIIVRVNTGIIYTTSQSKTAEHGGLSDDDRHVACFVSNPQLKKALVADPISTRQVAPTILAALGLDPKMLQGAVAEGTAVLSGPMFAGGKSWGDWN